MLELAQGLAMVLRYRRISDCIDWILLWTSKERRIGLQLKRRSRGECGGIWLQAIGKLCYFCSLPARCLAFSRLALTFAVPPSYLHLTFILSFNMPAHASVRLVALSGGPQEGVYNVPPRHMQVNLPRNINDSELIDPNTPDDFEHPLSVPTSTSYLIQRIKLATICRKIVDTMPMSPSRPDMIPYEEFIALDMEFEKLLNELPPFFQVDDERSTSYLPAKGYEERRAKKAKSGNDTEQTLSSNATNSGARALASQISTQRFMIRMTTHTRRCKFHQPLLVRGFTDPKYHYSRDVCLRSARVVIGIQQELDNEGIVATGLLGLSGLNHHLFFATIALVMDLCFNLEEGPGKEQREKARKEEVWRACRILEEAKERSMPAKRFLESLMNVLRKHRVKLADPGETGSASAIVGVNDVCMSGQVAVADDSLKQQAEPVQPSDFEEIWQTYIDNAPNLDVENWEELFNDLDSF